MFDLPGGHGFKIISNSLAVISIGVSQPLCAVYETFHLITQPVLDQIFEIGIAPHSNFDATFEASKMDVASIVV